MRRFGIVVGLLPLVACASGAASGADAHTFAGADAGAPAADAASLQSDASAPAPDAASAAGLDAGLPDASPVPSVRFVSPAMNATVPNPVVFVVAAENVEEVQIFADETYPLGLAWDPTTRDSLRYRFSGTGIARSIVLIGRNAGVEVARAPLTITVSPDSCEDRFFVTNFNSRNTDPTGTIDVAALREDSLSAIKAEVQAPRSRSAA